MGNEQDNSPEPRHSPDQIPKLKWSDFATNFAEVKAAAAEMRAEADERDAKKFAKSKLGKFWIPLRETLKKTQGGRVVLGAIFLTVTIGFYAVGIALLVGVNSLESVLFPPDYQLTQAEKAEGYDFTCSGKGCSNDDVAYRFYTDAELATDGECQSKHDWCVYAIPVSLECERIYVEYAMSKDDGFFAADTERHSKTLKPENGKNFALGERISFGFDAKKADSVYSYIDSIYCGVP